MNLVLLAGLDGTGILFEPFLKVATIQFDEVFIYQANNETNQTLTYQANHLAKILTDKFSKNPIIIIAESNGGLLAYQLLAYSLNIRHIFFVACFLTLPNPLARLVRFIKPIYIAYLIKYVPSGLLNFLLFYRYGNDKLLNLFKKSMNELNDNGNIPFINRCQILANLNNGLDNYQSFDTPCTYIKARQDFLVFNQINNFANVFNNFRHYTIDGSHFLLQTNPIGVWGIIQKTLTK